MRDTRRLVAALLVVAVLTLLLSLLVPWVAISDRPRELAVE